MNNSNADLQMKVFTSSISKSALFFKSACLNYSISHSSLDLSDYELILFCLYPDNQRAFWHFHS